VNVDRQPRALEARYPGLTSFLYRLFPMGRRGRIGSYFNGEKRRVEKLPLYNEIRHLIPRPVLDGNREWIDLYDAVWKSVFTLHLNPRGKHFTTPYIDAALDKKLYQWDMTFIIMYARYVHHIFPAIGALDNFYARQREDGMIWRVFSEKTGSEHWWGNYPNAVNPPLFAWTEVEYLKMTGDASRVEKVLPALEAQSLWLERSMRSEKSVHKLFWNSGDGSGMDNTPRRGSGWVDMTAQVVLNHRMIARLSRHIGADAEALSHELRAGEISDACNRFMWDQEECFYYDIDDEGSFQKVKTIAGFWPLVAKITTEEQARDLVAHLENPSEFDTPVPFPSLARDQEAYDPGGRYWLGGIWAPTSYMVIRGLQENGYDEYAGEASEKYLSAMSEVYERTGTIWELYAPEPDEAGRFLPGTKKNGRNFCQDDFIGWSGIGPVALLIESVMGIRVRGDAKKITWHLRRSDRHGMEGLIVADSSVTLICQKRITGEAMCIETERDNTQGGDVDLEIITEQGNRHLIVIKPGNNFHEIPDAIQ